MKSILLSILFLLVPKLIQSQSQYNITADDDAIYLDSLFNTGNQKNHKYIRVVKDYHTPDKKSYKVEDYYKSGTIAMSGTTINKDKIIETGVFVYYYENGIKKEEREYAESEFATDKSYKINQYWDENNNHLIIDGNGFYASENKNDYIETGTYKDGYRDGIYEGKDLKENTSFIEKYENGKFISGTRIFADNTKSEYLEREIIPVPKNGIDQFYKYIARSYQQPSMPAGTKGKVFVSFIVDIDGKIVEPTVIKDIGYGAGIEAIRILNNCENWIPGEKRGLKVRWLFSLPINVRN